MKRALCSLCIAILTACHEATKSPVPDSNSNVPGEQVVIEMYGDSTTHGDGAPRNQSEPAWLQTMVPPGVLIVNEGVNGTTATQLLEGKDGFHPPFAAVMAKSPARIVIIQFGLNDTVLYTPEQFSRSLSRLVEIAAAAGKSVVLQEPNPSCTANRTRLPIYVDSVRQVAQKAGVPLVRQYEAYPEWRQHLRDCLHPDSFYYRLKALNTFATISALLPQSKINQPSQ